MKIVSVQDISCYGGCSLTAALPILSAKGIETAILPSAILSTHTGGFTHVSVRDLTDEMPEIIRCWIDEGIVFDAIMTGYIGDARQFEYIALMKEKLLKDGGTLIVDPAMADHGKLYRGLGSDIVDGMRRLVRTADVILPNLTEAALLLGREYAESLSRGETADVLKELTALGPDLAVLTGVSCGEKTIGAAAYRKSTDGLFEYFTAKQPRNYHGTGDVFASVFTADILGGRSVGDALKDAAEFVSESIRVTIPDESHGYGVKFQEILKNRDPD